MSDPSPSRPPTFLYFDADVHGGHWVRHLDHLVRFVHARGSCRLVAVLADNPDLHRLDWWSAAAAGRLDGIELRLLPPEAVAACRDGGLGAFPFARLRTAQHHARLAGAGAAFFANLNAVIPALATRPTTLPCAGILLNRPPLSPLRPHDEAGSPMRHLARYGLYRLALANPGLRYALTFDARFARFARRRWAFGAKVRSTAQPIEVPLGRGSPPAAAWFAEARRQQRRVYLVIGAVNRDKGVIEILNALAMLPAAAAGRVALLVTGRIAGPFAGPLEETAARVGAARPEVMILADDRFLTDGEYGATMAACDVVLLAYPRSYHRVSSTATQAVLAGRAVIGPDWGTVGREIASYRLGATVDAIAPQALRDAILADLAAPLRLDAAAGRRFLAGRRPEAFARSVVAMLMRASGKGAELKAAPPAGAPRGRGG